MTQFSLSTAASRDITAILRQNAAAHVIYYSAAKLGENWTVTIVRVLHDRMDPELHLG